MANPHKLACVYKDNEDYFLNKGACACAYEWHSYVAVYWISFK